MSYFWARFFALALKSCIIFFLYSFFELVLNLEGGRNCLSLGLAVLVILECHSKRFGDGCLSETPFSTLLGGSVKLNVLLLHYLNCLAAFRILIWLSWQAEKIPGKEINQIVHG